MKNIILIGMPGCGKSTVGVILAKIIGYSFLDSDLLIQEKDGRLLSEIISQEGLDGFNKIENKINASIDVSRSVIATGGSVIYGEEAMEHFKKIGIVAAEMERVLQIPNDHVGYLSQLLTDYSNGFHFKSMLQENGYEGYIFNETNNLFPAKGTDSICVFLSRKINSPSCKKLDLPTL